MTKSKWIYFGTIIVDSIFAAFISDIFKIHWSNALSLCLIGSVLYHILEWKYDWSYEEGEEVYDSE